MTLKTDANGQLLRTHPGITTTDIPHGKEFLDGFDRTFGKRCIKHPSITMPCERCAELNKHFAAIKEKANV